MPQLQTEVQPGSFRMDFRIYNTLSRQTEPLKSKIPGQIGLYQCGPTVYDVPHVGHARSCIVFDTLTRTLRHRGVKVTWVRNVTDVDDKILARAAQNGESPLELSNRMTDVYNDDMRAVGCAAPDHEPRVSAHVPQIVQLIEKIVAEGKAYVLDMASGARDVYFSVRSFESYGKLSRRKLDELVAGARIEADETKRDPLDFALWKGAPRSEWGWDSPWGWGRPGWHIECSAMSTEYLGHGFDVHGGGMDLIFPHHENEIAQAEAAHPHEGAFAHAWMHNGFVNIDKEKMSKSLGNFVTVRDVFQRNDPEALRLFLLGVHYRGPIQFDTETLASGRVVFPGVDEAERRVDYLYATRERLKALRAHEAQGAKLPKELAAAHEAAKSAREKADAALADDLNTSVAIAELGELAKLANEAADLAQRRAKDAAFRAGTAIVAAALDESIAHVIAQLGVLQTDAGVYRTRTRARRLLLRGVGEADVERRVVERVAARQAKDFARADVLRAELASLGVEVHDSPTGSTWTIGV